MRKDYRDERVLNYLIKQRDMSNAEAARVIGCDQSTVWKYANEYGIERREQWRDKRVLYHLYVRKGFSMNECADALDTSYGNIQTGMEECGIDPRKRPRDLAPPLNMQDGYEVFFQDYSVIPHHRLHYYAVKDVSLQDMKNKIVHHKNGIRWDNREENYEMLTKEEHGARHKHSTKSKD